MPGITNVLKTPRVSIGVQIARYLLVLAVVLCLPAWWPARTYRPVIAEIGSGIRRGILYDQGGLLLSLLIMLLYFGVPAVVIFRKRYTRVRIKFRVIAILFAGLTLPANDTFFPWTLGVVGYGLMMALYFCLTKADEMWRQGRRLALVRSIVLTVCFCGAGSLGLTRLLEYQRWQARDAIVKAVESKALKPDLYGSIALPARWDWAACDRYVCVVTGEKGNRALFFPETAFDAEYRYLAGFVYSPVPLPSETWFSFSASAAPPHENVVVWKSEPVRPGWYYAEPYYSD